MKHDDEMCRDASAKRERLNFLMLSAKERQARRADAQDIINREIARGQKTPSVLALRMQAGFYDEPKTSELERLEAWDRGEWVV